ncbi:hypothetical protein D5086_006585 [Populus alba]|uniref:Uncharacterized protein n=1 Tax=Populus alba TaxID=43335 RepID=A0ACC4CL56_POPAL
MEAIEQQRKHYITYINSETTDIMKQCFSDALLQSWIMSRQGGIPVPSGFSFSCFHSFIMEKWLQIKEKNISIVITISNKISGLDSTESACPVMTCVFILQAYHGKPVLLEDITTELYHC